jgi:hypothetical protein
LQGEEFTAAAQAIRDGTPLEQVPVTPAERLLLEFVGTLTKHAYRITDEQVDRLRGAGWNDEQIAEAVYDGALFNLFVRLADAFDIHPQPRYDAAGMPAVLARGRSTGVSPTAGAASRAVPPGARTSGSARRRGPSFAARVDSPRSPQIGWRWIQARERG